MLLRASSIRSTRRNDLAPTRGNFRVKGDTVDVFLAYADDVLRINFWGEEIDGIEEVDGVTGARLGSFDEYKIYPANLFMTTKESRNTPSTRYKTTWWRRWRSSKSKANSSKPNVSKNA